MIAIRDRYAEALLHIYEEGECPRDIFEKCADPDYPLCGEGDKEETLLKACWDRHFSDEAKAKRKNLKKREKM